MLNKQKLSDPTRVLVLRPRERGFAIASDLEQRGFYFTYLGVTRILPVLTFVDEWQRLSTLQKPFNLIFTSVYAVNAIEPSNLRQVLPLARSIIAIGPATQKALLMAGYEPVNLPLAYNSQGVLDWIEGSPFFSEEAPIYIIGGKDPKTLLIDSLRERGMKATHLVAYQRQPTPSYLSIADQLALLTQVDIIVSLSLETLEHGLSFFDEHVHRQLGRCSFVVPTSEMATYLRQHLLGVDVKITGSVAMSAFEAPLLAYRKEMINHDR